MQSSIIRTESLTKYYGKVVGVENLDMEVAEGEVFGFLGPNGAGKTTTLRLLMGLLRPSGGRATVMGLDTWKRSVAVKDSVGYLPGEAALYRRFTGAGLVRFISGFHDGSEKEGLALAERLELDMTRKVAGYSRGMKQKLAIILALMKKPPLLLMDEPTNALDPLTQRVLYDILNEYRETGTTILFSSHNLPEVERIADRVGIIRDGHIVATEKIEDLRSMRLRNIEVIFEDEVPEGLDHIPGVSEFERAGKRIQLKLQGDIDELIKLVASSDVTDMSITHASLEDVFLEFYGGPEEGASTGDAGGREEGP